MITVNQPRVSTFTVERGDYLVDLICEELGTHQTRKLSVLGVYDGYVNAADEFGGLLQFKLVFWLDRMNPRRFVNTELRLLPDMLPAQQY